MSGSKMSSILKNENLFKATNISLIINELSHIDFHDEDSCLNLELTNQFREEQNQLKLQIRKDLKTKYSERNPLVALRQFWFHTLDKYLESVKFASDKSTATSKAMNEMLDTLPEPSSKKYIKLTIILTVIAVIIFLSR